MFLSDSALCLMSLLFRYPQCLILILGHSNNWLSVKFHGQNIEVLSTVKESFHQRPSEK